MNIRTTPSTCMGLLLLAAWIPLMGGCDAPSVSAPDPLDAPTGPAHAVSDADPYGSFNFRVAFEDDSGVLTPLGRFSSMSVVPAVAADAEADRGGTDGFPAPRSPSRDNVVLKRGIVDLPVLEAWLRLAESDPRAARRTLTVELEPQAGRAGRTWTFFDCFPLHLEEARTGAGNKPALQDLTFTKVADRATPTL